MNKINGYKLGLFIYNYISRIYIYISKIYEISKTYHLWSHYSYYRQRLPDIHPLKDTEIAYDWLF